MKEKPLAWATFAIKLEEKGLAYYRLCVSKVNNPYARSLFSFLAGEEEKHATLFTGIYEELAGGDRKAAEKSMAAYQKLKPKILLFEAKDADYLDRNDTQISVMLNKAMRTEQEAVRFYSELFRKEQDVEMRKLFARLINEETIHVETVRKAGMRLTGIVIQG